MVRKAAALFTEIASHCDIALGTPFQTNECHTTYPRLTTLRNDAGLDSQQAARRRCCRRRRCRLAELARTWR